MNVSGNAKSHKCSLESIEKIQKEIRREEREGREKKGRKEVTKEGIIPQPGIGMVAT